MKRWVHSSSTATSDILEEIQSSFGSDSPGTGCSFIDVDGTYINIYPKLDVHEDLCEWANDNLDAGISNPDEEYFVRNYGWIRLRSDPSLMIIEMPSSKPTSQQWYSLEDWLLFCEEKYGMSRTKLSINICDDVRNTDVPIAFGSEYFAEDVVKLLKRYYSSGAMILSSTNNYFSKIPKKYRQHIVSVEVEDSDDYNSRGQRLKNYTAIWDNGDEHTFQNLDQMIWSIKENTSKDGYYVEP